MIINKEYYENYKVDLQSINHNIYACLDMRIRKQ